jgi:hypothetical protein
MERPGPVVYILGGAQKGQHLLPSYGFVLL